MSEEWNIDELMGAGASKENKPTPCTKASEEPQPTESEPELATQAIPTIEAIPEDTLLNDETREALKQAGQRSKDALKATGTWLWEGTRVALSNVHGKVKRLKYRNTESVEVNEHPVETDLTFNDYMSTRETDYAPSHWGSEDSEVVTESADAPTPMAAQPKTSLVIPLVSLLSVILALLVYGWVWSSRPTAPPDVRVVSAPVKPTAVSQPVPTPEPSPLPTPQPEPKVVTAPVVVAVNPPQETKQRVVTPTIPASLQASKKASPPKPTATTVSTAQPKPKDDWQDQANTDMDKFFTDMESKDAD